MLRASAVHLRQKNRRNGQRRHRTCERTTLRPSGSNVSSATSMVEKIGRTTHEIARQRRHVHAANPALHSARCATKIWTGAGCVIRTRPRCTVLSGRPETGKLCILSLTLCAASVGDGNECGVRHRGRASPQKYDHRTEEARGSRDVVLSYWIFSGDPVGTSRTSVAGPCGLDQCSCRSLRRKISTYGGYAHVMRMHE